MTESITLDDVDTTIHTGKPHKVILFNDENHSMDEVIEQIIKAVHCTAGAAGKMMLEAHNTGRAVIFGGSLERCELVAQILEEIRLGVKIEPA